MQQAMSPACCPSDPGEEDPRPGFFLVGAIRGGGD
jgi:hypothetical protein